MNAKKRYLCALAVHAIVFVLECVAFWPNPFTGALKYYTQLSNLLALFVSAACLIEGVLRLKAGKSEPSEAVRVLSYVAVCMLTLTFLVDVFILSRADGLGGLRHLLFHGEMLYMHFLCPVIALLGFFLFEKEPPLTNKHLFLALLPTLLYAAVTIVLNIMKVMHGPYPFLYVYEQPVYMSCVWFFIVVGGAALIAWALKKGSGSKK